MQIAVRQDALARQLIANTEAARKKREEWERRSEETALAKMEADAAEEARRKKALKERMDETVGVLNGMVCGGSRSVHS